MQVKARECDFSSTAGVKSDGSVINAGGRRALLFYEAVGKCVAFNERNISRRGGLCKCNTSDVRYRAVTDQRPRAVIATPATFQLDGSRASDAARAQIWRDKTYDVCPHPRTLATRPSGNHNRRPDIRHPLYLTLTLTSP